MVVTQQIMHRITPTEGGEATGGPVSRLFGSTNVHPQHCDGNIQENVISIGILENLQSNFDLSRISRTSEGGRANAPNIATTTE